MNTILNLPKGNDNQSIEIEFTFDGHTLLETKTKGDEHRVVLESLFDLMVFYNFIPKDKKGRCTLTDGEINDEGESTLDVYYYYGDEQDEDNTPILIMNEDFIDEIKSEVRHRVIEDILKELLEPVKQYINSEDFEYELINTFDEVGLGIKVKPPITLYGITIGRYTLSCDDTHEEIKKSIVLE